MKKTSIKTILQTDTFHLTGELKYVIEYKNGKELWRGLKYTGKKLYGLDLNPIYKNDISLLREWNPYWGDLEGKEGCGQEWLKSDNLPEPEDVDLSKVIYVLGGRYFDINKNPIPVVIRGNHFVGDCTHFTNYWYDLEGLELYLMNHPNVISCSGIKDIPEGLEYESREGVMVNKYIEILVLPTVEMLRNSKLCGMWSWYYPGDKKSVDLLGVKQFAKKRK